MPDCRATGLPVSSNVSPLSRCPHSVNSSSVVVPLLQSASTLTALRWAISIISMFFAKANHTGAQK
ncbi:hypothetical protein RvY_18385 [Ramazzottius varieornatus]|uniref:Uncharacterized protein n=1 Tax=Ramazzottius varieornatus TaxID=947166 RepID=A0A1D1W5M2_RAMVA|nr:hypothetical protein RvY_18385 [Ramazzottius varieornatus]